MNLIRNPYLHTAISVVLLWLALPGGAEFWPLLLVGLVPVIVVLAGSSPWQGLRLGFVFGFLHFLVQLYWIVIVLGRYGGLPWFVSIPALLLLASYMALYPAVFGLLAGAILRFFPGVLALVLLPCLWVGLDWCRSWLFTGFPWMDLGYGLYRVPELIQVADIAGHHGLTWLLLFTNVFLVLLWSFRGTLRQAALLVVVWGMMVLPVGWYSMHRLAEVRTQTASGEPTLTIGIVQGNIDQSLKWSAELQQTTVDKYLAVTNQLAAKSGLDLVVWPETALPFYPPGNQHMATIARMQETRGLALLTGAPWYEVIDRQKKLVKFYNNALLLNPTGEVGGMYAKSHLVPFGEYVPLKRFLPFLAPLVEAVGDFSPGKVEQPLLWGEGRLGVLICFESVFPDITRHWVNVGANVLVNLTNDAWYGRSSAPHQSLAMAVLRAVEARRFMVRSANTGISAFIGPDGRIAQSSPIFVDWGARQRVSLHQELTFWARYGYLFAVICLALGLSAGLFAVVARHRG